MRADKGNTVIAMYKSVYLEKTAEFSHNFEIVNTFLMDVYQKDVQKVIKDGSTFNKKYKYTLTVMNPQPPKLYSLWKLHKVNEPIRPAVSFVTAPSVKLSKRLIPIILYNTNFTP